MAEKDTTQKTGIFDFFINHSKKAMIGIVCVSVLVLTATVAGHLMKEKQETIDPNVVAEVGGEKIYLKDYKERLFAAEGGFGTPDKPASLDDAIKKPVLDELVQLKIVDKELAKRNITISDAELVAGAKDIFKDYATRDASVQKAYKDYIRLGIGKDKLKNSFISWKEGYILNCFFSRADQNDMAQKPDAKDIKAKDETYAKDYCTKAKERLETGKSNYVDELAKLTADPVLGETYWKPNTMTYGEEFNKSTVLSSESPHPPTDYLSKLESLSAEKNKYHLITVQDWETGDKKRDVAFSVVYIKDGNKGETTDLEKWLKEKEKEYNVKTYIGRVKI